MILILDNNNNRSIGLNASLGFIGEVTHRLDEDNFEQECAKYQQHECMVILGALQSLDHENLIKRYPTLPFLLIGETLRPLLSIANVVGLICEPFNHEVTTQLLHDCQQYHRMLPGEHKNSQPHKSFDGLVGETQAVKEVRFLIEQVAKTDANVLILGESGTGKEVVARNVHLLSKRSTGPFVPVNCGAIPAELLESELFGHTKGAFTDAKNDRMGRFEAAQAGSLFLDEIGTIPLNLQPKLLRVLESGEFEPVGSSKTLQAEVRLIAASNIDFQQAIAKGGFRQDLYYRINTIVLEIPPLRQRKEDILPLAEHFLIEKSHKYHKNGLFLSEQAKKALCQYDWPGNIRELSHVIERAILLSDSAEIAVSGLNEPMTINSANEMPFMTIDEAEQQLIKLALQKSHGRVIEAGELLGLGKNAIYRRLEKYQIDSKS